MKTALKRFGIAAFGGAAAFTASSVAAEDRAGFDTPAGFSPDEYRKYPLVSSARVSHDTMKLTFAYPSRAYDSGIKVAGLVCLKCTDGDGKAVVRPYTPISPPNQKGTFDLLVKKYEGGKMGTFLHDLRKGDLVEAQGPWQKIDISANKYANIGMIAGGSGITPMYQIIQHLLLNPNDTTNLSLIYANKSEKDILLKHELDDLAKTFPRFNVFYTLNNSSYSWQQGTGNVNTDMLRSLMPADADSNVVLVCGPPGMMKHVSGDKDFSVSPPAQGELDGLLKGLNYSADNVFKF